MKPLSILYVEDERSDVDLLRALLKDVQLHDAIELNVVENGDEALNYLNRQPPYENTESPDLVLVDLNTPKTDGRSLIKQIKTSERTRRLPVVVFSTSGSPSDVDTVFNLGASMFLVKPMTLDAYKTLLKSLYEVWANHSRFPSRI